MIKTRTVLIALCILFASVQSSVAQQLDSTKVIYLDTNLGEAFVFADSTYLGRASQYVFSLPAGTDEIKLVPPEVGSWSVTPEIVPFEVTGKDTMSLEINFPFYYKIESIPYDAEVYLEQPEERKLLGSTPLLYTSSDPLKGMILLAREGYESVRLTPGEDIWNQHLIEISEIESEVVASNERFWTSNKPSTRWVDYTAAGVALVSGILAIRYKTKANRRFDRYRVSGDPALRGGFERYDRYSAISLGAMQAGIGVIAIRLVLK